MKCIVAFGTVEGHTRRVAEAVARSVEEAGHQSTLQDISQKKHDVSLKQSDAIFIAAPVHQERHPDTVIDFAKANAGRLNSIQSAFISVSLSAAFPEGQAEAQSYVDRFLNTTGWTPTATQLVAGALLYNEYDFFQEQIIRHIVLKGRDVDDIKGNHVFTDWDALKRFVRDFAAA